MKKDNETLHIMLFIIILLLVYNTFTTYLAYEYAKMTYDLSWDILQNTNE